MSKKYRYVPKMASSIREMVESTVSAHGDDISHMFKAGRSDEVTSVTFREFYDIIEMEESISQNSSKLQ